MLKTENINPPNHFHFLPTTIPMVVAVVVPMVMMAVVVAVMMPMLMMTVMI